MTPLSILETYPKQPGDTQDFDIRFINWLAGLSDTGASHTVTAEPGINLLASTLVSGVVKVWLSGGTSGNSYKITAVLTTTGGRVKEAEIMIDVVEI